MLLGFAVTLAIVIIDLVYSDYKIGKIEDDIANKNFIVYEGDIVYDNGFDKVVLKSNGVELALFEGFNDIPTNFVEIPLGESNCVLIYLEKSKAIVYYSQRQTSGDN